MYTTANNHRSVSIFESVDSFIVLHCIRCKYHVHGHVCARERPREKNLCRSSVTPTSEATIYIYKAIWDPTAEETLGCTQESSNPRDRYAVSVQKDGQIVGRLPRKISPLCSFIGRGGTTTATVTREKRSSVDLPQGGMEIPCYLHFNGPGDVLLTGSTS